MGAGEKRPGQEMISESLLKRAIDFDSALLALLFAFGPDINLIWG